MMAQRGAGWPSLDWFRLVAVVLVVSIHTSPLLDVSALGDFWLTRVLARLAVPFFLMVSGYFLARGQWQRMGYQLKKLCLLYAASVLLYLPINCYAGQFEGAVDFMRKLLIDGTFYHLWYFPAVMLGMVIARWLWSCFGLQSAIVIAVVLYAIGLGGDSYYGLVAQVPFLHSLYEGIFAVCGYTRNGLFYAPLFLLLGAAGWRLRGRVAGVGLALALLLMSAEGLWLHALGAQRHDSMYVMLPLCMVFLFSLLLSTNKGERKSLRVFTMVVYVIHPLCIILVRGVAKVIGGEALLIDNHLLHFLAVMALSALLASLVLWRPRVAIDAKARAWREVDLAALRHNIEVLRASQSPQTEIMAVVKADAYGHGAVQVARTAQEVGVNAFAVACLAEGVALRKAHIRGTILILGYTPPEEAKTLARYRLTQTVADAAHGRALAAQGKGLHVHVAVDTGMHRLGIPDSEREDILEMFQLPGLSVEGVFSHLCVSDSLEAADVAFTHEQLGRFYDTVEWLRAEGVDPGKIHVQASYGFWNLPAQPCDYARAGLALFGVTSDRAPVQRRLDLQPVLALRARVGSVRTLAAGDCAGYGRAYRATTDGRMAVVTIGYGDGLPRHLAAKGGEVLIGGVRCPIVGRMCMDQLLVDVSALETVQAGDVVTIIGRDGDAVISAEEVAERCDTITNEILSRMGTRLPLVY